MLLEYGSSLYGGPVIATTVCLCVMCLRSSLSAADRASTECYYLSLLSAEQGDLSMILLLFMIRDVCSPNSNKIGVGGGRFALDCMGYTRELLLFSFCIRIQHWSKLLAPNQLCHWRPAEPVLHCLQVICASSYQSRATLGGVA